jgi:cytoplasmic iron level regulating protein YaaA (DUF328/UPF0246 family)
VSELVIIGCGQLKRDHAAPAGQLYIGQHFTACLRTALAIADRADVRILSALHGLLTLDDVTAPYDVTMGQPGAVSGDLVATQAAADELLGRQVIALCSARYVAVLREVWPEVTTPLAGLGIGYQRHALAVMRQAA